jgi:hypothetical protein
MRSAMVGVSAPVANSSDTSAMSARARAGPFQVVVGHGLGAQPAYEIALRLGRRGAGDLSGAEPGGELDEEVADPAGGRLHQHGFAGREAAGPEQTEGERRGHRENGCAGRVGAFRYASEPVDVECHQIGRRVLGQAGHAIADLELARSVYHPADDVPGQGAGQWPRPGARAGAEHGVDHVGADCLRLDDHLTGPRSGLRHFLDGENLGTAVPVVSHRAHNHGPFLSWELPTIGECPGPVN